MSNPESYIDVLNLYKMLKNLIAIQTFDIKGL